RRPRVSPPFTGVAPPLGAAAGVNSLAAEIDRARRDAGIASVEVRARVGDVAPREQPALQHGLPLTADPKEVAGPFRSSVRRNIRAAEESPAVVRLASSESDVTERFYRLQVDLRRRLGPPGQPRRFFRLLWSRMIEPGLGRVLLVDVGSDTVAGAVFLTWNHSVVYKDGASDPRYWSMRPQNPRVWEAVKRA